MTRLFVLPSALILLAATACGGGRTEPAKPASAAAPTAYKDMNLEQRETFMKEVVVPTMAPLWAAFDPKLPALDCKTCHGKGADDGSWEMPNPEIEVLPSTPEAYAEFAKRGDHGVWTTFMAEKVEPEMAKLLGMTPFDPKTMTGEFSCNSCHTLEGGVTLHPKKQEHDEHGEHAH